LTRLRVIGVDTDLGGVAGLEVFQLQPELRPEVARRFEVAIDLVKMLGAFADDDNALITWL
jgi:hypothetical protein